MFNFSANHLFLISQTEYASCAVFVMLDHDTRRVFRLFDFTKRLRLTPGCAYCVAGKVNSVNTLYLVIESVKLDAKHERHSTTPVPADGAGGSGSDPTPGRRELDLGSPEDSWRTPEA